MLKTIVKTIEEIPEAQRALYKENEDGMFVLQVEDIDTHPLVKGMKDSHEANKKARAKLSKQVEELTAKVKDIPEGFSVDEWDRLKEYETSHPDDPAKNKTLHEQLESTRKLAEQKFERQIKELNAQLAAKDGEIKELNQFIESDVAGAQITQALLDNNYDKRFIPTLKRAWASNVVVEKDEQGKRVAKIRTEDEELVDIAKYAKDHAGSDEGKLFQEQPKGSGGGGSERPRQDAGDNPWLEKSWSITEQGRIIRADKAKAERLAKAAGTDIYATHPVKKAG